MSRKKLVTVIKTIFISGFFFCLQAPETMAQTGDGISSLRVVGAAQVAEGEIIADRDDNRDVNGVLTAGLRITSDLTGFTFESNNGIHKIQQQPGASLLYLSPNERVVTIYREGFTPFQLVLASHNIQLQGGKVWEIQITGDRKLENAPVRFIVQPENSTLIIDGKTHQISGTTLDLQLAEGDHVVEIQKNRYRIIEDTISVSLSTVNSFNYQLQETPLRFVLIESQPAGASIYMNDEPGSQGRTPRQIPVYPGTHKIRLELDGYVTQTDEVQITNTTEALSYNMQEYAGYLTIRSTPANATLIINGQVQPQKENIRLIPGPYQIELTAPSHDPVRRNIDIAFGDTLVQQVNLSAITGILTFAIMQPDANITLKKDNQIIQRWQGSKRIADLPTGKYVIEASLTNFRSETAEFEITRNREEVLNFNLLQIDGVGTIGITGIFTDAKLEIRGSRFRRSYTSLPVNIESLPYGQYTLRVTKKGFKPYETTINFNNFQEDLVLIDEFSPKTKTGAIVRSAFIPGAGHMYLNKGGRGFLYLLGSAAAIGYTVKSIGDYQKQYDVYSSSLQRYNNATSDFAELRAAYENEYSLAQQALDDVRLGLTVFAVLKGIETFDLLTQKSNKRIFKKAKLQFNAANSGISMRVEF